MKPKQTWIGPSFAIVGACLLTFSLVTAAQAFAPIAAAFQTRGFTDSSESGAAVGELLVTATIRGAFALPALILITLALLFARYRARWFFWFVWITSIALIPLLPVGTAFAFFFFVYLLRHRDEFGGRSAT